MNAARLTNPPSQSLHQASKYPNNIKPTTIVTGFNGGGSSCPPNPNATTSSTIAVPVKHPNQWAIRDKTVLRREFAEDIKDMSIGL